MSTTWTGTVSADGHLVLDERGQFRRWLAEKFSRKNVVVTVEELSRRRTTAQNSFLWAVVYPALLDKVLEENGYDHHERRNKELLSAIHYDLLSVRFGTTIVMPMLPGAPSRIAPQRTSSHLTTAEMSDYFDWVVRYAAEHYGVVIRLPDEQRALNEEKVSHQ